MPLIRLIDQQTRLSTKTRDSLDRIELGFIRPVLDLDESIVERYSLVIIFEVNIDTQVNELLFSFKGSISCSRRHIHSVMEQIPSLVINFINFSSILHQACNFCLVTSNKCVLESEEPNVVHVVDVSSTNDELFSVIKVLF